MCGGRLDAAMSNSTLAFIQGRVASPCRQFCKSRHHLDHPDEANPCFPCLSLDPPTMGCLVSRPIQRGRGPSHLLLRGGDAGAPQGPVPGWAGDLPPPKTLPQVTRCAKSPQGGTPQVPARALAPAGPALARASSPPPPISSSPPPRSKRPRFCSCGVPFSRSYFSLSLSRSRFNQHHPSFRPRPPFCPLRFSFSVADVVRSFFTLLRAAITTRAIQSLFSAVATPSALIGGARHQPLERQTAPARGFDDLSALPGPRLHLGNPAAFV